MKARRRRSGMAIVLVVTLMAVVCVMSLAMLSASSLRAQTSGNAVESGHALALAESGANLALYYLLRPESAPALNGEGYWPGQAGINLGFGGTTDVVVTRLEDGIYEVISRGRGERGMEREVRARARIGTDFQVLHAAGFRASALTIERNTRIIGNVRTDGQLSVAGRIDNTVTSPVPVEIPPLGFVGSNVVVSPLPPAVVPTMAQIRNYRTYRYEGRTYQAVELPGNLNQKVLGPTPENPAGVYWTASSIRLPGEVVINGTLLVLNGDLIVHSGANSITARPGFPALIVSGDLHMENAAKSFDVNGLAWIAGSITRGGSTNSCILTIRGSLLMAGSNAVMVPNQGGRVTVQYDANQVRVPDFSSTVSQAPSHMKVLTWQAR